MKALHGDANMTDNHKDTAWMNSVDPLYAKIADEWMKQIIGDFGTDHVSSPAALPRSPAQCIDDSTDS